MAKNLHIDMELNMVAYNIHLQSFARKRHFFTAYVKKTIFDATKLLFT
jgi:hypothetical protein